MNAFLKTLLVLAILSDQSLAKEWPIYTPRIESRESWEHYSRTIGDRQISKFIIDVKSGEIFFFDVNIFRLHADFVLRHLHQQTWNHDNVKAFNQNYEEKKPLFILGIVSFHPGQSLWTLSFWEGDKISAADIKRTHEILQKSFFQRQIQFLPMSDQQEQKVQAIRRFNIQTTTNDALYRTAPYQPFRQGASIGKLRIVPTKQKFEDLRFSPNEIVVLQESYPDIPPVAGIITAAFSTPLSHVNLRARAWGIPSIGIQHVSKQLLSLNGRWVKLSAAESTYTIRLATPSEIREKQNALKPRAVTLPALDLEFKKLPMLTTLSAKDVHRVGAKTANLGQMASHPPTRQYIPKGFSVPFYFHGRHLEQNDLQPQIDAVIASIKNSQTGHLRKQLADLRQRIIEAPLDPHVLNALYKRARIMLPSKGWFVRSSTNAEDLKGFSGAGLYDTVPNVRGKEALGVAVKTVWASLWNERAVLERSYFGISHSHVAPAVLIQEAVPADAAGVLVTKDLFDPESLQSFTISATSGHGMRVVRGKKIPEQLVYDMENQGIRVISRSNDPTILTFDLAGGIKEIPNPNQGAVLTEQNVNALAEAVLATRTLFPNPFLDYEWLFHKGKVWLVQCRPFVEANDP